MTMKMLYLSDLDGTLLHADQRTGDETNRILNELIARGCPFSYATARAFETASGVTAGLNVVLPVAVHNGAMIVDANTRNPVFLARFSRAEIQKIIAAFGAEELLPVAYSVLDGRNRFSYLLARCGAGQRAFLNTRIGNARGSERAREIFDERQISDGDVFYFSCIAERERLARVYRALQSDFRCFFYRERYSGDWWLEVMRRDVSKASAALKIKEATGCDRLVCFGDDINDVPLFEVADECYAVDNAIDELKQIATGVIASNEEDGVARWLETHFGRSGKGEEWNF